MQKTKKCDPRTQANLTPILYQPYNKSQTPSSPTQSTVTNTRKHPQTRPTIPLKHPANAHKLIPLATQQPQKYKPLAQDTHSPILYQTYSKSQTPSSPTQSKATSTHKHPQTRSTIPLKHLSNAHKLTPLTTQPPQKRKPRAQDNRSHLYYINPTASPKTQVRPPKPTTTITRKHSQIRLSGH